jgi:hypothetical protein
MGSVAGLQCLRPYLFRDLPVARRLAYTRFYNTARCLATQAGPGAYKGKDAEDTLSGKPSAVTSLGKQSAKAPVGVAGPSSVQDRVEELKAANALAYPRIQRSSSAITFQEYTKRYGNLKAGVKLDDVVTIRGILLETINPRERKTNCSTGRVLSVRISGKKLVFMDIIQDGQILQAICNLGKVGLSENPEPFRAFSHLVRRGDIICK